MSLVIVPPWKLLSSTTITPRSSTITTITGNAGGLTINGGTATTNSLTLVPNTADQTGNLNLNGLINIFSSQPTVTASQTVINYSPTYTNTSTPSTSSIFLNYSPTVGVSLGASSVTTLKTINIAPAITFNSGLAWIYNAVNFQGTINSTANAGFANSAAGFIGGPTISSSTAAVPPIPITSMFNSSPTFTAGNVAVGSTFDLGFLQSPIYSITGASSSMTVTSTVGFKSNSTFSANTAGSALTVSSRVGLLINDPTYTSTGTVTVTENIGLRFANQSQTSGNRTVTSIKAIDMQQTSGTGVWNLFGSGNAASSLLGSLIIGTNAAAASEAFQVIGNAILGFPTLNTGILKLAHASSSNVTGIQAGNATSAVTYILPTADGGSGQVLTTNGSGTLSWTTGSPGSGTVITSKVKPSDQSVTNSAAFVNDVDLTFNTVTNQYVVSGMLFATATTITPDIKINFTVAGGASLVSMNIGVDTFQVGLTAVAGTSHSYLTTSGGSSGDIPVAITGGAVTFIKISGTVKLTNAGTFTLQFAQNTATPATSSTLKAGSYISIYPV